LALAIVLSLAIAGWTRESAAADQPIAEAGLISLIDLKIDDEVIVARIKKAGLAFAADEAALKRLAEKGASDAVLAAVREAGAKRTVGGGGAVAITYADVLKLLQLEIPEDQILKALAKSPTVFTLSKEQIEELKAAGATDALIRALTMPREAPVAAAELISNFAIVLDCSKSMEAETPDKKSKMTAAKRVVADLIKKIPNGLNVTFVIYGHEVFAKADDPRNCQAVKVARPLSKLDDAGKTELAALVESLKPTGGTPIALALKVTGQELAKDKDAFAGIVLITDGLESCKGTPNEEAANLLASLKLSFGVNVVGLGVKEDEDAALKALADAGGGKYYDADDADGLADSLAAIAKELEVKAKPAEVVVAARRALKFVQPKIEMPAMKKIVLIKEDGPVKDAQLFAEAFIEKYGDALRVVSAAEKYDVVWYPQNGEAIRIMKGVQLTERKLVEVKIEDLVGFIKVNGEGKPESIHAGAVDDPGDLSFSTQRATKFGEIMVVPIGSYNVFVNGGKIEEGLKVESGKLYELE
jgi:hypothetical protein